MTPHQKQSRPYWHWERAMNTRHPWSSETETHARRRSTGKTKIQGSRCRPSWTHRHPLVAGIMLLTHAGRTGGGFETISLLIEARKRIPAGDVELKYISNHLEIGVASIDKSPGAKQHIQVHERAPIGYALVSSNDQDLTAWKNAPGCSWMSSEKTFTDQGLAGGDRAHLGLKEALAASSTRRISHALTWWRRHEQS